MAQGGRNFAACVASVSAALRADDELIVVADGNGDGTWRAAEAHKARIVHRAQNGGPAKARNLGASKARGDLLVFVDADVSVPPDCLERMRTIFAADDKLSAVIGSYDDAPGERNFLSQFKNLFHHYVHQRGAADASTFWGACGAIRREVFFEAGGFDESYPRSSIEDIELGYRLRAASHRIRLVHGLQVKHWKRWKVFNLLRSDFLDRAAPWTELILARGLRKNGAPHDLNLGLTYKLSLATSFLLLVAIILSRAPLLIAVLVALFLFLNWPLFRFFNEKRGWRFCSGAVCWRFVYDICSGLGFCLGVLRFAARRCIHGFGFSRPRVAFNEVGAPSQALP